MSEKQAKTSWFKRHKVLSVILGFIVLVILVSALGGGDAKKTNNRETTKKTETSVAKLGQPARDGKFEFTVASIDCSQSTVGSQYLTKTAQGKYCQLHVTVKNVGNEAQSMFSGNQKLLNAQGQEYSADDQATAYTAADGGTWVNDINPGNSVTGVVVFDLPSDQTPVTAELHDSAFSGGVKVTLQ